ncbi:Probable protein phosphatase 2C 24 [Linum grandiflorum]
MADICCGVVSDRKTISLPSSPSSSSICEPTSRDARRRRMEIRRFKVVPGVVDPSSEDDDGETKRQKLEVYKASFSWNNSGGEGAAAAAADMGNSVPMMTNQSCENGLVVKVGDVNPVSGECRNLSSSRSLLLEAEKQHCYPKYGVASVCGRRRDMEDAVAIHPSFCRRNGDSMSPMMELHYFGVYDGHGCSHVASRCRARLHELVKEELRMEYCSSEEEWSEEWKVAMEKSFGRMDKEVSLLNKGTAVGTCRCEMQTPECDAVGSTATVAVVSPEKIIVANCGDSRAILCRNGKPIPLSTDHKPDRPDELDRIQAAGGRVIYWDGPRVLGVLAMSRAIGDNYLKPYVISEPEVTITERASDDDCLIIASDGLWDVVSNDTACGVARMCLRGKGKGKAAGGMVEGEGSAGTVEGENGRWGWAEKSDRACSDAAMLLTKLALARHSSDNVSVVVVDLRRDT